MLRANSDITFLRYKSTTNKNNNVDQGTKHNHWNKKSFNKNYATRKAIYLFFKNLSFWLSNNNV